MTSPKNSPREEFEQRLADAERFAGLVAHEIKGEVSLLARYAAEVIKSLDHHDTAQIRSDAEHIQRLARNLTQLVDALLSQAKQQAHSGSDETTSLRQAALDAVRGFQDRNPQVAMLISVDENLPMVTGSPILWCQVFLNVLENAARAAARTVEITGEIEGQRCTCAVHDDGPGLGTADPARLFDPFYSHGAHFGTGLGLYCVRRTIEQYGGRVWAKSDDTGTTIKWSIPLPC